MAESTQTVTLTFFHFEGFFQQWWALRQMQAFSRKLSEVPGLTFYKLLGSGGGNGFSIIPDLSTYALLLVWEHPQYTHPFFVQHAYYQQLVARSATHWTLQMKALRAKGVWSGKQPFHAQPSDDYQGPVAVLTRATIRWSKLWSFWRHVPAVSRQLTSSRPGLLFSKGIGEKPLLQQATFSLWHDRQAMVGYAYRGEHHRKIIGKTRQLKWYKEELFAEFVPVAASGQWPALQNDYVTKYFSTVAASVDVRH